MSPPAADTERAQRFADLYDSAYQDVLRFVRRRTAPDAAEDVVHETFLIAWRRFDRVPLALDEARAWLFGTARNCLLSDGRARMRREQLGVRIAVDAPPSAADADPSFRLDLVAAWERLEPGQQEVLALTVWEELPSSLAGAVLGISAAAYRIRLHRARVALRRLLEPDAATNSDSVPAPREKHA